MWHQFRRGEQHASAPEALTAVLAEVDGDADEPGTESGLAAESLETFKRFDERLLNDVLDVVGIAHEVGGDASDLAPVNLNQLVECRVLTGQSRRNQCSVVHSGRSRLILHDSLLPHPALSF